MFFFPSAKLLDVPTYLGAVPKVGVLTGTSVSSQPDRCASEDTPSSRSISTRSVEEDGAVIMSVLIGMD
jgi:hypothetical protein